MKITSLQNQRVKLARSLHQKKHREREGKLLLEGVRLIGDALDAGVAPEHLFYTEDVLDDRAAGALVEQAEDAAVLVSSEVLENITDTVTPQGIAAVLPQPARPWPDTPSLILICDGVRDPGNMGTLIRAAAGAGVDGVVAPAGNVDVWNPKALRAGMGAHFRLPIRDRVTWDDVPDLVAGCTVRLADVAGNLRYYDADWRKPSALIVGGEAAGAGRAATYLASETISIPLFRDVESLNAAMAGAIIMFEARRQQLA